MSRKVTLAVLVVALLLGTMLLGFSAQNEYCLPWQERVGQGDGPLGPDEDFTACR
jgi:RsiW-degrading membrane proteinase PrsW (M82 family)